MTAKQIAAMRRRLLTALHRRLASSDANDGLQDVLVELSTFIDDLDDIQESIALRLSPEFRAKAEAALREAGIAEDAQP